MSDKRTFIDSNIILYLFTDDNKRKNIVNSFLSSNYTISTQVINENVNVCLKKLQLGKEESFKQGNNLMNIFNVVNIFPSTINTAFRLSLKYGFSYWDSLIVSTALENNCDVLFSEDMHDGLVVEERLKISNPFKSER